MKTRRRTRRNAAPARGTAALALVALALLPAAAGAQVVEYYHLDALGNVRAISNQAGQIVRYHDYLPFGEEWNAQPDPQPRRFTGKERDTETGLDYFGARYYAASVGRFTAVDPVTDQKAALANPQLWNRYAYARNNPLRYVDPDGRLDFALDSKYPAKNPDAVRQAYAAQDQLRGNITAKTAGLFRDLYGYDVKDLLTPGKGPTVSLAEGDPSLAGGVGDSRGGLKINAGLDLFGDGAELFGAATLHELTHWAHDSRWFPGAVKKDDAVERYRQGLRDRLSQRATGRPAAMGAFEPWHRAEAHYVEVYQFGRVVTLEETMK